VVLFTVLALAPGDPLGELARQPERAGRGAPRLRAKFGLDDPV
jgi:peptide/nickel transport system permease protein